METNNGRCAPLCQHPGCWEGGRTRLPRKKHTQYDDYMHRLRHYGCSTVKTQEEERDLPVLSVLSLAVGGISEHRPHRSAAVVPLNPHSPHLPPSPPPLQQPHSVQVLLENSPSTHRVLPHLSFSPVLIWQPGRQRPSLPPSQRTSERTTGRGHVAIKTHELTASLPPPDTPPSRSSSSREKPRLRPHSRMQHSLDLLQDIPDYIMTEIIHQLQSESTSTLSPSDPSPPHQTHSTPTSPAHQERSTHYPVSCHVPSSIVYDLSTRCLYRASELPSSPAKPPPPPQPPTTRATRPPPVRERRKRTATLPLAAQKTSFSRALSLNPETVIHKREHVAPVRPPHHPRPHAPTIHTIDHGVLPPTPHPPPSTLHPHRQALRYPLGNPTIPRTPHRPSVNPLLAPYHHTSDTEDQREPHPHIHLCHVDNTHLVTLHWTDYATRLPLAEREEQHFSPASEEATPSLEDTAHLPPISSSLPSPSPPPTTTTLSCVSPDHMHVGAEIVGDQLVLQRAGEHTIHPLRDSSQTHVGGASRPETTPSAMGVVTGTQAPPPTASLLNENE